MPFERRVARVRTVKCYRQAYRAKLLDLRFTAQQGSEYENIFSEKLSVLERDYLGVDNVDEVSIIANTSEDALRAVTLLLNLQQHSLRRINVSSAKDAQISEATLSAFLTAAKYNQFVSSLSLPKGFNRDATESINNCMQRNLRLQSYPPEQSAFPTHDSILDLPSAAIGMVIGVAVVLAAAWFAPAWLVVLLMGQWVGAITVSMTAFVALCGYTLARLVRGVRSVMENRDKARFQSAAQQIPDPQLLNGHSRKISLSEEQLTAYNNACQLLRLPNALANDEVLLTQYRHIALVLQLLNLSSTKQCQITGLVDPHFYEQLIAISRACGYRLGNEEPTAEQRVIPKLAAHHSFNPSTDDDGISRALAFDIDVACAAIEKSHYQEMTIFLTQATLKEDLKKIRIAFQSNHSIRKLTLKFEGVMDLQSSRQLNYIIRSNSEALKTIELRGYRGKFRVAEEGVLTLLGGAIRVNEHLTRLNIDLSPNMPIASAGKLEEVYDEIEHSLRRNLATDRSFSASPVAYLRNYVPQTLFFWLVGWWIAAGFTTSLTIPFVAAVVGASFIGAIVLGVLVGLACYWRQARMNRLSREDFLDEAARDSLVQNKVELEFTPAQLMCARFPKEKKTEAGLRPDPLARQIMQSLQSQKRNALDNQLPMMRAGIRIINNGDHGSCRQSNVREGVEQIQAIQMNHKVCRLNDVLTQLESTPESTRNKLLALKVESNAAVYPRMCNMARIGFWQMTTGDQQADSLKAAVHDDFLAVQVRTIGMQQE